MAKLDRTRWQRHAMRVAYELNKLEQAKVESVNCGSECRTKHRADIVHKCVLDVNFQDTLGENLTPFLLNNSRILPEAAKSNQPKIVDRRLLWRIRKELDKCDVESVDEQETKRLSPLQQKKNKRTFKGYVQTYMGRNWKDICFLKNLRNKNWMPHSIETTPLLQSLPTEAFREVCDCVKMLHTRSPLYNERTRNFPDPKVSEMHKQAYLYRRQYQTRRDMHSILEQIRYLRCLHSEIDEISNYIEKTMASFTTRQTHRIMPWKFEFVNEVYNLLGLSHIDRYAIPFDCEDEHPKKKFFKLLDIQIPVPSGDAERFVFGLRSTYKELGKDERYLKYRKLITHLDDRFFFSKFHIERAYLQHETGRAHLKHFHYDDCISAAKKSIKEAKECNSYLWQFLAIMLTVRAYTLKQNLEKSEIAIIQAQTVAFHLRSPMLDNFLEMCLAYARILLEEKTLASALRPFKSHTRRRSSSISQFSYSSKSSEFLPDYRSMTTYESLKLHSASGADDDLRQTTKPHSAKRRVHRSPSRSLQSSANSSTVKFKKT